jgi:hypothetical protein
MFTRRWLYALAGRALLLLLLLPATALAQDSSLPEPAAPTTTTTTTITQPVDATVVRNARSVWSVVEYPMSQTIDLPLVRTLEHPDCLGCFGKARIFRSALGTTIKLDLLDFKENPTDFKLYAVDQTGRATLLGPLQSASAQSFNTTLSNFMLVVSSDDRLADIANNPNVVLRSAVPEGFAVVRFPNQEERYGAAVGEFVAATSNSWKASSYNVPMLGIPSFRRGTDTEMKINLSGAMTGSRANIFIEPRKDGPTTIKMRFHELKDAPAGQVYVLWAVSPDNKYVRLGQIVNTGQRNEAQIQTETALQDFGLLITMENEVSTPTGTVVGTIIR